MAYQRSEMLVLVYRILEPKTVQTKKGPMTQISYVLQQLESINGRTQKAGKPFVTSKLIPKDHPKLLNMYQHARGMRSLVYWTTQGRTRKFINVYGLYPR